MCGIIGVASSRPLEDRAWLEAGCTAMAHRGPDDSGSWWSADGRVGLAQRRLAIIDLSPSGHQPMHHEDGGLSITFNGEIYNYRELRDVLKGKGHSFASASDTEVLLAAYREWGTDCLTHLNGMFAFALYDRPAGRLLLARDRAGEKPLFYTTSNGMLRFSSELKGLFCDPSLERRLDSRALDCFLMMGFVPGEKSILSGVSKLPPAHALSYEVSSGKTNVWQYWRLPDAASTDTIDDQQLVEELETLLLSSVKQQLIADVPVGVLLSGGVDSSLVTAMAARAFPRVKTFTVGLRGHEGYDEGNYANLVAQHFGTDHTELQAGDTTPEILGVLARQYDEPLCDSSMIPTFLVSQLIRQHCTVALGGDGADELFGGYRHHQRLQILQSRIRNVPLGIRRSVATAGSALLPTGFRGRNWLGALSTDFETKLPFVTGLFTSEERCALMGEGWDPVGEQVFADRIPHTTNLLQRVTRTDFQNYLPDDILVKVDRASMLASLEVRAPFLDFRILEFAFRKVPSRLKADQMERKILLKRLCARVLPPQFDANRKQGFSIPLPTWLKAGPWRKFVSDVLLDSGCTFEKRAIARLLEGHGTRRNNSERLFGLTIFELWRRAYLA
ncbi:asparagine synthase (glutamine-hydrolyzing) [Bradyrhizobium elkanii]